MNSTREIKSRINGFFHVTPAVPGWKRALDLACCILALPAITPALAIVAAWIKLTSPGPVLFKQDRVGYMGRTFCCLKFRTMKMGATGETHRSHAETLISSNAPMIKLDATGDSRLIFGAWLLRATGLDELPQVFNIFRGEMSLVGPRPCIPYEYSRYLPHQKARFCSVPGLTGLWQVRGKNKTTFEQMIQLDIAYGTSKNLWLDLQIIFMTLPAIIIQVFDAQRARVIFHKSGGPSNARPCDAQFREHRGSKASKDGQGLIKSII